MLTTIIKKFFPEILRKQLRKLYDLVFRLKAGFSNTIVLTDTYGSKFFLYPYQTTHIRWLIARGAYQKEVQALRKCIPAGKPIFDIGANVGALTTILSSITDDKNPIYSFEPHPETFKELSDAVHINHRKNINLFEIAFSDTNGKTNFYFDSAKTSELNSLGKVTVNDGSKTMSKSVEVIVETIDSFTSRMNIPEIGLLKIDVEGFEDQVLKGASSLLQAKKIEYIQFEISASPLAALGKKPADIVSILTSFGYTIFKYNDIADTFEGPVTNLDSAYDNYYATYHSKIG